MITVLTSVCGGKDNIVEQTHLGQANWLAYVDQNTLPISNTWKIKPAYDKFVSSRRNSRVPKILSHLFCDTEYSIWIDGNAKLLDTPENLIAKYLGEHDLAVLKHPIRDCIYDEALVCAKRGLDDPEVIIEQVKTYEEGGYAKHKGLCECGLIIRRHTAKVKAFNHAWWSEYSRYSVRDQISFMHAADSVGLRYKVIDLPWLEKDGGRIAYKEGLIELIPHLTAQQEPI